MKRPSLVSLQLYATLLAFLTLAILGMHVSTLNAGQARDLPWALMLVFAVLTGLAGYFTLPLSRRTKIVVDSSVVFASILLFPPPWSALVPALGTLGKHLFTRRKVLDLSVNVSVKFLEAWGAQQVYLALGGTLPPRFSDPALVTALLGAGIAFLTLDRVLVYTAVALAQGMWPHQVLPSMWTRALREDAALVLLGVLTALVVDVQPWALGLTVIPIALVYLSLRNSLRLEVLTLEAVEQMADVIDRRDPYTAGHSRRVAELAERIAIEMGLPMEEVSAIRAAARVHDLGKIAIDASVLNKPGRLSDAEWEAMKQHPIIGAEIISRFPEFARGADYVRYHHERWDGQGYPYGLRGEEIPLGARIIAVADAFDAMRTDRPYRRALTLDVVIEELKKGAGKQWDPQVVEAFLRVLEADKAQNGEVGVPVPA